MSLDKLLTPKEAAKWLGVSLATLRGWRRQGKGPTAVQLTQRTIRYPENGLKEYVEMIRKTEPGEAWR